MTDPAAAVAGPIPDELRAAVPARRLQYAAGRFCARSALAALGVTADVGRGSAGEPVWPEGYTGSITHSGELASAAVVRSRDLRGIGIDSHQCLSRERADGVAHVVTTPEERAAWRRAVPDAALFVTMAFTLKEALFKCLYPLVRRQFFFDAASIGSLDPSSGAARLTLAESLHADFPAGTLIEGSVVSVGGFVHAAIWLC